MNHELICSWLGIPIECWPPDHYRLLGLEVGEENTAQIELRVHQRLDAVRRYQMTYPEEATEAMNRLAQAFVCLTEKSAKRSYDATLPGLPKLPIEPSAPTTPVPSSLPSPPPSPNPPPPPIRRPRDPLIWLYTPNEKEAGSIQPPPVRGPGLQTEPPPLPPEYGAATAVAPSGETSQTEAEVEDPTRATSPEVVSLPPPEPVDPILEAARNSRQARKGLNSRKAIYQRVLQTRQLRRMWQRLSRYLDDPTRKLARPEAESLYKLVERIEEASEGFPLIGEAGQPGHLIFSLTQLDRARMLLALNEGQRESLRRDWEAGLKFLDAHQSFLRQKTAAMTRQGGSRQFLQEQKLWVSENPMIGLLLLLALIALIIALWRTDF